MNHAAAVALYCMHFDFGRVHQTLRVTPAMEADISDHVWSIEDIALISLSAPSGTDAARRHCAAVRSGPTPRPVAANEWCDDPVAARPRSAMTASWHRDGSRCLDDSPLVIP